MFADFKDFFYKAFEKYPLPMMTLLSLAASGVTYKIMEVDMSGEHALRDVTMACLTSLIAILVAASKLKSLSSVAEEKRKSIEAPANTRERLAALSKAQAFYGIEVSLVAIASIFLLVGVFQKISNDARELKNIHTTVQNTASAVNSISEVNMGMKGLQDSIATTYRGFLRESTKMSSRLTALKRSYDSLLKAGKIEPPMKDELQALSKDIRQFTGAIKMFSDTIPNDPVGLNKRLREIKEETGGNQPVPGVKPE